MSSETPHASETSIEKEKETSERMWGKWNSNIQLVGMENVADPGRVLQKQTNTSPMESSNPTKGICLHT